MVKEKITEVMKENVRDVVVNLNTAQSGVASLTTGKINGMLKALIVTSKFPVQIRVGLDGYDNIVLYSVVNFSGEHYEALRVQPIAGDKGREGFNYASVEWALNDRLKMDIRGPKNVTVKIIVRYMQNG